MKIISSRFKKQSVIADRFSQKTTKYQYWLYSRKTKLVLAGDGIWGVGKHPNKYFEAEAKRTPFLRRPL